MKAEETNNDVSNRDFYFTALLFTPQEMGRVYLKFDPLRARVDRFSNNYFLLARHHILGACCGARRLECTARNDGEACQFGCHKDGGEVEGRKQNVRELIYKCLLLLQIRQITLNNKLVIDFRRRVFDNGNIWDDGVGCMRMGVFSYRWFYKPSKNNSPLICENVDRARGLLGFFVAYKHAVNSTYKHLLPIIAIINFILFSLLSLMLVSCVAAPALIAIGAGAAGAGIAASKVKNKNDDPEKSQLQIRELQTRTYDTPDSKMVLKTMLNVLQDDGFIVTEGNVELGLLSATKELDVQTEGAVFWGSFFNLAWDKNAIVEATANVSEFGKQTRVRINFQQKVYDSSGSVSAVDQIYDPKFYQEFFAKVDKGLFIQQEKI